MGKWIPYIWNWDKKNKQWKLPYYPNLSTNKLYYATSSNPPNKRPLYFPESAAKTMQRIPQEVRKNHTLPRPPSGYSHSGSMKKAGKVAKKQGKKVPMTSKERYAKMKRRLEKKPITRKEAIVVFGKKSKMAQETDKSKVSENLYSSPNQWWKKYPSKSDVVGIDEKVHFKKQ